MPLMSGPGAIGVVMALAANVDNASSYLGMVIGIGAVALSVVLFFFLGGPLVRRLGPSAVGAINKIFGFLILAIAVQLVWDGVAGLWVPIDPCGARRLSSIGSGQCLPVDCVRRPFETLLGTTDPVPRVSQTGASALWRCFMSGRTRLFLCATR